MYPTSAAYNLAMAADSLRVVVRVDIYTAGLTSLVAADVPVSGGSVTEDRTAATRRTATVTIPDDGSGLLVALTGSHRLDPGPLEMAVSRGLVLADDTTELIPLGVFRVSNAEVTDSGGGPTMVITGYDRSRGIARNKLTDSYYIAGGTGYLTAAGALVDNRMPFTIPVAKVIESIQPTTTSGPIVYLEGDDPWARVGELCAAVGCEVFFDRNGSLRIRDIPDPTLDPTAATYTDGENALLLSLQHALSDEPGTNGVIYIGADPANSGTIPRALVVDADPTSPSYYYGPYGQVTETVTDPLAITTAQCQTAGAARLRAVLGLTETLTLSVVPNPALGASDVIRVIRAASGIDLPAIVESLTIPLDVTTAGALAGRARRAGP